MSGLSPSTLDPPDLIIEADDGEDRPQIGLDGAVLKIEHPDGAITISLDGRPLVEGRKAEPLAWFDNLVDEVSDNELGRISNDLLRAIEDDKMSRKEWEESYAQGIKLLGFKLEVPGLQGASDGAPVEGMSKVRHPLLAEAVLQFQANARSELLPTDGPVKIRDDHNGNPPGMGHNGGPSMVGTTLDEDQLAEALEQDLNYYLTSTATEYYPDTDRMLLKLGFGGMAFKKGYQCPLRERPVLETVDADDLIVNNNATDLKNARRITHRITLSPSTVKRLQILGVYRDVALSDPTPQTPDSVQQAEKEQQGIVESGMNPSDRDREIYECYCELELKGFEHQRKGKDTGLEIPYRVTIDVSSQQILSIVRNYDEDTKDLPEPRVNFVKYTFIPGFGFCDIGLLHILGNTTNAATAAWREMLDNGMYANFPGFLISKEASRQNTNLMRVPPGGGQQVDTQGKDIRTAIMPLPYNTQQMGPLMQLTQDIVQSGQRLAGTSQLQVGEGRPDAPVGTTLAMIEQATKILNTVHKRMHSAQTEEFRLLMRLFREHPESFVNRKDHPSGRSWTEEVFLKALEDFDLVPQADPNTASHNQRVMKIMALLQLSSSAPTLYDPLKIHTAALQAMGWSNPEQFFAPPAAQAAPPPQVQQLQAQMEAEGKLADAKVAESNAKVLTARAKAEEIQNKSGLAGKEQKPNDVDVMDAETRRMDADTKRHALALQSHRDTVEDHNRDLDREAEREETLLKFAQEVMSDPQRAQAGAKEVKPIEREIGADET